MGKLGRKKTEEGVDELMHYNIVGNLKISL